MKKVEIIQIILLGIITFLVFKPWFFSETISYEDNWYYFKSMFGNHFLYLYAWDSTALPEGLGILAYIAFTTGFLQETWKIRKES